MADAALDSLILATVQRREGQKGVGRSSVLAEAWSSSSELTMDGMCESIERLLDRGFIYEPTLGVLMSTGVPLEPVLLVLPVAPAVVTPVPPEPPVFALSDEQEAAKQRMVEVLLGPRGGRLVVGGLAGVGKTVLIKHVLDECQKRAVWTVATVAFTGKATNVLRQKGIADARTIHSTIYHVNEDEETGKISFSKRFKLEDVTAFIVDESSMLNKRLYDDLLSYGLPIVFVGDHGQLEPVGDDPGVMRRPDILLETIHRQAAGSPIIQFAHALRNGQRIDWDTYDPAIVQHLKPDEADNWLLDFDMIICGFNATRNEVNSKVRRLQGRKSPLEVGDTLNCLRNDSELGVFNGMMFTVEAIHSKVIKTIGFMSGEMGMVWTVNLRTDGGALLEEVPLVLRQDREFQGVSYGHIIADYGYCLTAHRAQGSQADNVLVFEEVHRDADRKRWAYTAASRAAKTLAWVR